MNRPRSRNNLVHSSMTARWDRNCSMPTLVPSSTTRKRALATNGQQAHRSLLQKCIAEARYVARPSDACLNFPVYCVNISNANVHVSKLGVSGILLFPLVLLVRFMTHSQSATAQQFGCQTRFSSSVASCASRIRCAHIAWSFQGSVGMYGSWNGEAGVSGGFEGADNDMAGGEQH